MSRGETLSEHSSGTSLHSPLEMVASLPVASLPAFLRVLLTTDGTVTQSLEAYFWEPIEVLNCGQHFGILAVDEPLLQKTAGAEVLNRHVQLIGRDSRTLYAHADSSVDIAALPTRLREGLASGEMGIGELLRGSGFETYREIIGFGEQPQALAQGLDGRVVWRRYLIRMAGRPLILIREIFPVSVYEGRNQNDK